MCPIWAKANGEKMSQLIKSVLLSAFIFPGCGHFYLKKRLLGAVLLIITAICFFILLTTAIGYAQHLAAQIESGEIALNVTQISQAIKDLKLNDGSIKLTVCFYALVLSWLFGVGDCIRLGLKNREDAQR